MGSTEKTRGKQVFIFLVLTTIMTAAGWFAWKKSASQSLRIPASEPSSEPSYKEEIPTGFNEKEAADFNHLAEGSEIYPYEWLRALNSVTYNKDNELIQVDPIIAKIRGFVTSRHQDSGAWIEKKLKEYFPSEGDDNPSPFLQDLDFRFNFIKDDQPGEYLVPWVGFTTTWSDHHPDGADAKTTDKIPHGKFPVVGPIEGRKSFENRISIRMVGVNCAACHTGQVNFGGKPYRIDGAPNLSNIRGFFKDLGISTVKLFTKKEWLTKFLVDLNVNDAEDKATDLLDFTVRRFGAQDGKTRGHTLDQISALMILSDAGKGNRDALFDSKEAIADILTELLKVTYGLRTDEVTPELHARMKFLSVLFVGNSPKIKETIAKHGRTDAFGRISNLALRGDRPVDNTAPVSFPWIWGLKYTAMLHYNGNSNSVLMRNIGQSLGLGAVVLDETHGDVTTNLHNLDTLEKLAYKIKVPQWEKIFAGVDELKVDYTMTKRGEEVYQAQCMECHTTDKRVGPKGKLYEYKMYPLISEGTDPTHAKNIGVKINGEKFKTAIFNAMKKFRNRYFEKYDIKPEKQRDWKAEAYRGEEFFRDTLDGEVGGQEKYRNNFGDIRKGLGYRARHLSGIWATAPYLHNGSVPTMMDLLAPEDERPKVFETHIRIYDKVNLGYVSHRDPSHGPCSDSNETCFDTSLDGNFNKGHRHGVNLSRDDKRALIEYLKILPPEPEYAWQ